MRQWFGGLVLGSIALALAACGGGPSATIIDHTQPATTAATTADVTTGGTFAVAQAAAPGQNDPQNTLILELKSGKVVIRLRPDLAPKHVERVKELTKQGFYNGLKFHRVIPGFMAQTGDPKGDGSGGSKLPDLVAEFTPTAFERGTIGAARTDNPNTANSQFFICFKHSSFLNGQYTVWGNVIDGMQFVDKIAPGEPPAQPDTIVRMYLASDAG